MSNIRLSNNIYLDFPSGFLKSKVFCLILNPELNEEKPKKKILQQFRTMVLFANSFEGL